MPKEWIINQANMKKAASQKNFIRRVNRLRENNIKGIHLCLNIIRNHY